MNPTALTPLPTPSTSTVSAAASRGQARHGVAKTLAVMSIAAVAAVSLSAWAQAADPARGAPAARAAMFTPAGHSHGGGPGGWMLGRGMDRMLDSVNATDAQRTQIRQIADAARADLQAQRAAQGGLRDRAMSAFTQATVDAREVEAVRLQMLAQHDAASRRISQAMIDVSRVLTPEQRAQMAQRMSQRHDEMRRRMDGRSRGTPPAT